MASKVNVKPLASHGGSDVDLGALVTGIDVEHLSDADFALLRKALFTHQVLILRHQSHVSPKTQYELTQRFDPEARALYGHDKTPDTKRSILHPDLKTIPFQPQVQVIGNGFIPSYEGLENIRLRHPHHRTFHQTVIPEADDLSYTRFYRWHIDAALYHLAPPVATTLLAVKLPSTRAQTLRYDDGTGDELTVPLGTTAFVNGETMYDILSPQDKEFARGTKVEYAAHPYIWMSPAKSRPTGLGMVSEGKELSESELPPIDPSAVQILPMCWKNPVTGRLALQIHPSAVRRLHLADGTIMDDLKTVRELVYRLQRPGIAPAMVYAHDWQEGDLVIFHNRGVLHSVVGAFAEDEIRLFRQCNIAGSALPEGPEFI
ncbi:taurine catabolism dioxygenase tauD, tfdA family protein [Hirsutella rhossiliensis]|uniref:Taurine catabolism dioxygenase tauD, tfdA family domain-containing protein n=1 Tax=Hirsutella rhossiliensis TaxID=111463 RepID=A0A9P8SLQ6_9HYPO|nr:taurine catabolism dioxygenase tauD, tfdA family domain-containing protein [Hirsutella rhossiliensis]KAH0967758.1 taurine catabolism dioxygenase tauD, tfdA family domain-containing protein [Hirsutella rhossiliensis]